jgi:pimeloyl-ACP methyl ester carboxylesterase
MQFRMNTAQVDEYFEQDFIKPQVLQLKSNSRALNYLYLNVGKKPLVVFVHGAPGSSSAFIDFFKNEILQKTANLLSVDRPGYGYSNFGKAETSLVEQAGYLAAVIEKHKPINEKTILVGHSLGAPIIARLAMDFPELVEGLILVGGSIDPEQEKEEWYRPLGSNFLGRIVLPKSLWVTNEEIYMLKDQLSSMLPLWKDLQIPVTVIQGEADDLVPKENAHFARRMISKEYLDVWLEPDVNHFIPWNRPDLINSAIMLHLGDKKWKRSKPIGID